MDFKEEHGKLGWSIDPVDVLAYYTRRWLLVRGEKPSSPGLLHEMAKFLQMYSPLETLSPWRPAIARCWQYVTNMSRFHLTRSLRAPLEATEGTHWEKAYSKSIKMDICRANVASSDAKEKADKKERSSKKRSGNNSKKTKAHTESSNASSRERNADEDEGSDKPSRKKRRREDHATSEGERTSRENSSSPGCYVVGEIEEERKRRKKSYTKTQSRRTKRKNKRKVTASEEEKIQSKEKRKNRGRKHRASTREETDIVEVEDEEDNAYVNENYTCRKRCRITSREHNQRSPSPPSLPCRVQQPSNTTPLPDRGLPDTQIEAVVKVNESHSPQRSITVPLKVLGVIPSSPSDSSVVEFVECEQERPDGEKMNVEEHQESKQEAESENIEEIEEIHRGDAVSDSEFGDLLLPPAYSERHLDEVVEMVSLVGCDAKWGVEASFTATKIVHVCWESLNQHAASREIESARS